MATLRQNMEALVHRIFVFFKCALICISFYYLCRKLIINNFGSMLLDNFKYFVQSEVSFFASKTLHAHGSLKYFTNFLHDCHHGQTSKIAGFAFAIKNLLLKTPDVEVSSHRISEFVVKYLSSRASKYELLFKCPWRGRLWGLLLLTVTSLCGVYAVQRIGNYYEQRLIGELNNKLNHLFIQNDPNSIAFQNVLMHFFNVI